ncbi:MAG: GGDEF domain-containing protein [Desulfovermiculus sp.]
MKDVFARMGGEEFGILLPETGPEKAVQTAKRIRKLVQQLKVTAENGATIRFTTSLGASLKEDDQGVESLWQRADRALYAAKDAGRNRVEYKE